VEIKNKKAQEGRRAAPPPGGRGGLAVEVIRIAFAVQAVEAVGADHGILAAQVVKDVARKRMRCGSCCRAACNLPHLGRGEIPDGSPRASASPLLLLKKKSESAQETLRKGNDLSRGQGIECTLEKRTLLIQPH
jgi:hypothetical protein